MASEKEIRTKIASIRSTQKITKAMEMVAASKMRRAQERMRASRPYAEKIRQVIGHVARAGQEYPHPWLTTREDVKAVGIVVVSTDRGLCGGLNVNLFKRVVRELDAWRERGAEVRLTTIGGKGTRFFQRVLPPVSQVSGLGDAPHIEDLIGAIKVMLDDYDAGRIDRLFVLENRFVSAMSQTPEIVQLLPVEPADEESLAGLWNYIYEPEARNVLDTMLRRYIEAQIYRAVIENTACEMAARMIAMKSASDNAGELISELQLAYNKARQAAITQEISEIVGGAAAV